MQEIIVGNTIKNDIWRNFVNSIWETRQGKDYLNTLHGKTTDVMYNSMRNYIQKELTNYHACMYTRDDRGTARVVFETDEDYVFFKIKFSTTNV